MTDTTLYQAVITQADVAFNEFNSLDAAINTADPLETGFDTQFDQIESTLNNVKAWANQKILEVNQEEVMTNFMAELKVVFDKYSAQMEIGDVATGYGTNYGGGASVGVKFTATFEGVTSSKEISGAVIVGADLT